MMSKQNTFKAGSPGLQSPSNILSPKEKEKSEMEKYANELVMAEEKDWLKRSQNLLLVSPEWQALTKEMYSCVKKEITSSHISYFGNLSDAEKKLFVDRAEKSVLSLPVYLDFIQVMAVTLDEELYRQISEEMKKTSNNMTQVEHLVNKAALGSMELLKSEQGAKGIEKLLLNQIIPVPLRKFIWSSKLNAAEERKIFEHAAETNAINTISTNDVEITQKSQNILDTYFPELVSNRANLMSMKTVLSYYNVLNPAKLEEAMYYLMCPILIVYMNKNVESTGDLIEAYLAVVNMPRPYYSSDLSDFDKRQRSMEVATEIASLLQTNDPELHAFILNKYSQDREDVPSQLNHSFDVEICKPVGIIIERLGSGVLSKEVMLYVWDTCLIIPNGFVTLIPKFCVCVLLILKSQILQSKSEAALVRTVVDFSRAITLLSLQKKMEMLFMEKIRSDLGIVNSSSSTTLFSKFEKAPDDLIKRFALSRNVMEEKKSETVIDSPRTVKTRLEEKALENKRKQIELENKNKEMPKSITEVAGKDSLSPLSSNPSNEVEKKKTVSSPSVVSESKESLSTASKEAILPNNNKDSTLNAPVVPVQNDFITLNVPKSTKIGISLRTEGKGCCISKIAQGPEGNIEAQQKLSEGMMLVSVNEFDMRSLNFAEAMAKLKELASVDKKIVFEKNSSVELNKKSVVISPASVVEEGKEKGKDVEVVSRKLNVEENKNEDNLKSTSLIINVKPGKLGAKMQPSEGGCAAIVTFLNPESMLKASGVTEGIVLIRIDQQSIVQTPHATVLEILKSGADKARVFEFVTKEEHIKLYNKTGGVAVSPSVIKKEEEESVLECKSKIIVDVKPGKLGCKMDPFNGFAAQVLEINPTSAIKAANVTEGMVLTKINDESVVQMFHERVVEKIKNESNIRRILEFASKEDFIQMKQKMDSSSFPNASSDVQYLLADTLQVLSSLEYMCKGTPEENDAMHKQIEKLNSEDIKDFEDAQIKIYKKVISTGDIEKMNDKDKESYNKLQPKFIALLDKNKAARKTAREKERSKRESKYNSDVKAKEKNAKKLTY